MRVFHAVDVRSGILLATLDEFVESKSYVICVLSPDARYVLVGEPAETRLFAADAPPLPSPTAHDDAESGPAAGGRRPRQRPLARFPASHPPSALAVSADSRCAFVGQSFDCLFSVLDIDTGSSNFGQVSASAMVSTSIRQEARPRYDHIIRYNYMNVIRCDEPGYLVN